MKKEERGRKGDWEGEGRGAAGAGARNGEPAIESLSMVLRFQLKSPGCPTKPGRAKSDGNTNLSIFHDL